VQPPTGTPITSAAEPGLAPVSAPGPTAVGATANAPYVNSDGSIWVFNTPTGQYVEMYGPNSTLASAYASSSVEIASDGSVWGYSSSTQTWTQLLAPNSALANAASPAPPSSAVATAQSDYQSVLNWLQQTTLLQGLGISSVPNWIVVLGVGLVALKLMRPQQGRH